MSDLPQKQNEQTPIQNNAFKDKYGAPIAVNLVSEGLKYAIPLAIVSLVTYLGTLSSIHGFFIVLAVVFVIFVSILANYWLKRPPVPAGTAPEELNAAETEDNPLSFELEEKSRILDQYGFLIERAVKQQNPREYVQIERILFCVENLADPKPYLTFAVHVANDLFYSIRFDGQINGSLEYDGKNLRGDLFFISKPETIAAGRRTHSVTIRFEPTEASKEFLEKKLPLDAKFFRLNNLSLTYRGTDDYIPETELKFHTPHRILDGERYHEYEKEFDVRP